MTPRFSKKIAAPAVLCLVICDSAGVMYWGDSVLNKIEAAYLNGTGRTVLLRETTVYYYAFELHGGSIYFTDWYKTYVHFVFILCETVMSVGLGRHCSSSDNNLHD